MLRGGRTTWPMYSTIPELLFATLISLVWRVTWSTRTKGSTWRFHGNPELFISRYSEDDIRRYFEQVPGDCQDAYFYFNNTSFEAGYTNASELVNSVVLWGLNSTQL